MTKTKRFSTLILLGIMTSTLLVASPTPAHADRCQPEEFVLGPGGSPMDERDNPVCAVLDQYVYPVLCPGGTTPKSLVRCIQTLNPRPDNANINPPQYNPDYGRIYCGFYRFAFPDSTCTSVGADGERSSGQDVGDVEFGVGEPAITTSGPRAVSADGHFVSFRKGNGNRTAAGSCLGTATPDATQIEMKCYYTVAGSPATGEDTSYWCNLPLGGGVCPAYRSDITGTGRLKLCYQTRGTFLLGPQMTSDLKCTSNANVSLEP